MARKRKWVAQRGARVKLLADDDTHFVGMEPNPLPAGSVGVVELRLDDGRVRVAWDTGPVLDHFVHELYVTAKAF